MKRIFEMRYMILGFILLFAFLQLFDNRSGSYPLLVVFIFTQAYRLIVRSEW